MGRLGGHTANAFARSMIKALRAIGESKLFNYDAKKFRLTFGGSDIALNLHQAYQEHLYLPQAARKAHILSLASAFQELLSESKEADGQLLPVVRQRAYYGIAELQMEAEGHKLDIRPQHICDHLCANIVVDLPNNIVEVTGKILRRSGLEFGNALQAARKNLRKVSKGSFVKVAPGVFQSPWRDNYDVARILLPDIIKRLRVKGRHVVATPNRDTLLVSGTDEEKGLLCLSKMLQKAIKAPRFMTAELAVLMGSRWETWLPPPKHVAHLSLCNLSTMSRGSEYTDQKRHLEKRHERNESGIFVVSYSSIVRKDGNPNISYCVWNKGIRAWLPRTDFVALFEPSKGKNIGFVSWEMLQKHASKLLKPKGLYPERWEVKNLPSTAARAKLNLREMPE